MNRSPVAAISGSTRNPLVGGSPSVAALVPATVGAAAGGSLDTYGDNPSFSSYEAQKVRFRLRSFLWLESTQRSVRACGRCKRKGVDRVVVKTGPAGVGLSGLQHCAAIWICPVCAVSVWAERSLEIGMVASAAIADGKQIAFVSLTTRHHVGDRLEGLMGHLRAGWLSVMDGRGGSDLRRELGLVGHIRVTEVNYGANGWHPHFHLALIVDGALSLAEIEDTMERAFARWIKGVRKSGGKTPETQCQDVRLFGAGDAVALAEYLTKTLVDGGRPGSSPQPRERGQGGATSVSVGEKLGRELTQGQAKVARKAYGTLPARALLAEACDNGDADALDLWREYELATKGLRTISWSRGLRQLYGLAAERDDQSIVDDERGGVAVMYLTEAGLARIIGWSDLVPGMRQAFVLGDYAGLKDFMDTNGIGYEEITGEDEQE